ncbi:hypothetical protein ABGV42_00210 [Paenibacillus pabuli]|uniref:hypothetical protein n=1 Tax=Paenibacillus pabuli TaxID=1472 RepID=UPI003242571F
MQEIMKSFNNRLDISTPFNRKLAEIRDAAVASESHETETATYTVFWTNTNSVHPYHVHQRTAEHAYDDHMFMRDGLYAFTSHAEVVSYFNELNFTTDIETVPTAN